MAVWAEAGLLLKGVGFGAERLRASARSSRIIASSLSEVQHSHEVSVSAATPSASISGAWNWDVFILSVQAAAHYFAAFGALRLLL